MRKFLLYFAAPVLLVGSLLLLNSNAFSPISVAADEEVTEATFVGSDACMGCHSGKYDDWVSAAHSIRKYIEKGLILPYKRDNKRHLFCMNDVTRLKHIHSLIHDQGLNFAGIRSEVCDQELPIDGGPAPYTGSGYRVSLPSRARLSCSTDFSNFSRY